MLGIMGPIRILFIDVGWIRIQIRPTRIRISENVVEIPLKSSQVLCSITVAWHTKEIKNKVYCMDSLIFQSYRRGVGFGYN